jgi:hypothetical protein
MSTGAAYSDKAIVEPSLAAFETALMNHIYHGYNRQGLFGEMVEIGQFYCFMKQSGELPWKSAELNRMQRMYDHLVRDDKYQRQEYYMNLSNALLLAVNKWEISHFGSAEAYRQWLENLPKSDSPPYVSHATDEIAMRTIAAGEADRHLCPGWPDHPRPPD